MSPQSCRDEIDEIVEVKSELQRLNLNNATNNQNAVLRISPECW